MPDTEQARPKLGSAAVRVPSTGTVGMPGLFPRENIFAEQGSLHRKKFAPALGCWLFLGAVASLRHARSSLNCWLFKLRALCSLATSGASCVSHLHLQDSLRLKGVYSSPSSGGGRPMFCAAVFD